MAMGRKLTTTRSERLLGTYSYVHNQSSAAAIDPSELREEDIWSTADDAPGEWEPYATAESNGGVSVRSQHPISRDSHRHVGGLSMVFQDPTNNATAVPARIVHQFRAQQDGLPSPCRRQAASSAPVNVLDWSKILRVDSVESLHDAEDDEDDGEMVPPHEYLARSRKVTAKSVFEGVGRTLKGRDLSRVRDAVWSQTGFDG